METAFWFDSWADGGSKTSFHLPDVHPHARYLADLGVLTDARVLVPLCGKTVDLVFFAEEAARVTGVELVPKAITDFFAENALSPTRPAPGVFRAGNITILQRDVFTLTPEDVGPVDLVYDRACLIAFPEDMRLRYVDAVTSLTRPGSLYFLNTLEYQPTLPTPPFTVSPDLVHQYFGHAFEIEHVLREERPEHRMVAKFGLHSLTEHGFLLRRTRG